VPFARAVELISRGDRSGRGSGMASSGHIATRSRRRWRRSGSGRAVLLRRTRAHARAYRRLGMITWADDDVIMRLSVVG